MVNSLFRKVTKNKRIFLVCSPGLNTRETQKLCFIHACINGSVSRFISLATDISVPRSRRLSVSAVCFSWWQFVFRGRVPSPIQRVLARCDEMSLANTGSLYLKVPLRCFARLKRINLRETTISTKHFLQMVKITRRLRVLDIESCGNILECVIFKAKESLRYMTNVNINNNSHLSILSMACLCSFPSILEIRAKGLMLEVKESLFLVKTFPRLASGQIALETETSDSED